jgi:nucleoside 2-deoxyribosyltransferase
MKSVVIYGSKRFKAEAREFARRLKEMGHVVLMPIKAAGVDYWSEDNRGRVEAKKKFEFISEHMDKIEESDAILVVNMTNGDIENYVGANTFLETGFAHYRQKKIYLLNPLPNLQYIRDEVETIDPVILNGDLSLIV